MRHRIAVIGTGYMARKHCQLLAGHPQAELVTIVSTGRSRAAAEQFQSDFGFTRTEVELAAALADRTIEVVLVCSPDHTHPATVVAALAAGKHVLCEKPLARRREDFAAIERALRSSGRVLQVGMNCRFREQYSLARARVESGDLGTLRFARGTYVYNAVAAVRTRQKAWSLEHTDGVSPFVHGGAIHTLDLLQWIGGRIAAVAARGTAFELGVEWSVDTFAALLEFSSGALGELLVSGTAFRPNDVHLELWLSGGVIDDRRVFRRRGDAVDPHGDELVVRQEKFDLVLQFENLVQAIETGRPVMNTFEEARENFGALEAIERSIDTRARVVPAY